MVLVLLFVSIGINDTEPLRTTGKISLLHSLRDDESALETPNRFAPNESLIIENTPVTVFDIGEPPLTHGIWRDYFRFAGIQ